MRTNAAILSAAALGLLLTACQPSPLGLGPTAQMPSMGYGGVQEINDGELIFSPQSTTPSPPIPRFITGGIAFGAGAPSTIQAKKYYGPVDCPGLNCRDVPNSRGIGGPNGDFSNDYFYRYAGFKGPNPSTHYSNLKFNFTPNGGTGVDIRAYRGVVFWARGHGNFAVNLMGRLPGDGIAPATTNYAYSDYNFYLRRFGTELNGDVQWKEIVVYFTDMVQEFGLAMDLNTVLSKTTGLQFDQQLPYTPNFQLDLDYIRLFK